MLETGLLDKNGTPIRVGDWVQLILEDGEERIFKVQYKTVNRTVKSHPSFDDPYAEVSITGVVFHWNGYDLFPCIDVAGVSDVSKMEIIQALNDKGSCYVQFPNDEFQPHYTWSTSHTEYIDLKDLLSQQRLTGKEIILRYCDEQISSETALMCEENKAELMKENPSYQNLYGCPQSFGLNNYEGLCSPIHLEHGDVNKYDCERCWKLALSFTEG